MGVLLVCRVIGKLICAYRKRNVEHCLSDERYIFGIVSVFDKKNQNEFFPTLYACQILFLSLCNS